MKGQQISGSNAPTVHDEVLVLMVRRLADVYRPDRIFLFGSVARGDAGADSDYDLIVIVPDDASADLKQSRVGYRAVRDLGVPRDIFVYSNNEFNRQLHLKASFPSAVLREGILLYAA